MDSPFQTKAAPLDYEGRRYEVRVPDFLAGAKMAGEKDPLSRDAISVSAALFYEGGGPVFRHPSDVLRLDMTRADLIAAVKEKLAEMMKPPQTEAAASPEEVLQR